MTMGTPALLFGAISLLLLAYTNRFLVIAKLIRDLYADSRGNMDETTRKQIANLRQRVQLIKHMQTTGVLSFILCTAAMFCLFLEEASLGQAFFGSSVIALLVSLSLSLWEVIISTRALDYLLNRMENEMSDADKHDRGDSQ
jgi:hypothetical protein